MSDLSNGREDAINRLVESNLGFVVTVAREYRHLGLPFEDLLNEGNLGLIEAARRYDPEKGARFITYAIWWIRKLILRALTQRSTLVRIPDSKAKKLKDIRRAQANLRQSLGRDPSRREVSEHLEMRQENLDRLIQLTPSTASIDAPVDERHDVPLGEFLRHIGNLSITISDSCQKRASGTRFVESFLAGEWPLLAVSRPGREVVWCPLIVH